MSVLDLFANYRIVPIVVLHKPENAGKLADALVEGGLPAAEIAFRTEGAEQIVRTLADRGKDRLSLRWAVLAGRTFGSY